MGSGQIIGFNRNSCPGREALQLPVGYRFILYFNFCLRADALSISPSQSQGNVPILDGCVLLTYLEQCSLPGLHRAHAYVLPSNPTAFQWFVWRYQTIDTSAKTPIKPFLFGYSASLAKTANDTNDDEDWDRWDQWSRPIYSILLVCLNFS